MPRTDPDRCVQLDDLGSKSVTRRPKISSFAYTSKPPTDFKLQQSLLEIERQLSLAGDRGKNRQFSSGIVSGLYASFVVI